MEKIVLTKGSQSATVEITERGCYHSLSIDGAVVVSSMKDGQAKVDQYILDLFLKGWKFTGGESLSFTSRYAVGEAVAEGYQPAQIGELVMSLRNMDLHEKSRMILYSSQTLAGLKREGKTNTRWSQKSLQLVRWESVERFMGLMAQYFAKA